VLASFLALELDECQAPDGANHRRIQTFHTHAAASPRAACLTPREDTLATATDVKVQPLEDRVLVTIDEQEQTTASGLVIPETAKEKPQQGTVVAVGPGKRSDSTGELIEVDVAAGDTVLFSKYGGTEVKVEGQEYLILSARDILAKIG
jgi:chaperonin GroES